MSPYMTDQRGRQVRAATNHASRQDLGAAVSAAASLPRRDGVASSPAGVAAIEGMLAMPSRRDVEVADELHRTARAYLDRARVCVSMAENLMLGRPMAHGIAAPAVHPLADEPAAATTDGRPPAGRHEMNKAEDGLARLAAWTMVGLVALAACAGVALVAVLGMEYATGWLAP